MRSIALISRSVLIESVRRGEIYAIALVSVLLIGAVMAYKVLQHQRPQKVNIMLLYALQGALLDMHWNALPPALKRNSTWQRMPWSRGTVSQQRSISEP